MSNGTGKRNRDRRKAAEAKWRVVHFRQHEINEKLLAEVSDVCFRAPNLRRFA